MAKFLTDLVKDVTDRGVLKTVPDTKDASKTIQVRMSKDEVENALRSAIDIMGDYLSDNEKLYLIGFMNFEPKDYKDKHSKHPQTGAPMTIPAYRTVSSKPSEALKKKLAAGHARDHA